MLDFTGLRFEGNVDVDTQWNVIGRNSVKLFRFSHHHLAELVEVHGSRTVLIQLFKDSLQFLVRKRSQQLRDETSEGFCSDVAKTFLVINPECILEFSLHGLHIRILHQECSTKLTEFPDFDLSRTILIDLLKEILEFLLSGTETHGSHDLSK